MLKKWTSWNNYIWYTNTKVPHKYRKIKLYVYKLRQFVHIFFEKVLTNTQC